MTRYHDEHKLQKRSVAYLESERPSAKEKKYWLEHSAWAAQQIIDNVRANPDHKSWSVHENTFDFDDWEPSYVGVYSSNMLDAHMHINGFKPMACELPDSAYFFPPALKLIPMLGQDFEQYSGEEVSPEDVVAMMELIIEFCEKYVGS
jgi:hypothetical protein